MRPAFLSLFSLALAFSLSAQTRDDALPRASPSATVSQTVGITQVTVTYGRPSAKGRTLFGAEGSDALETYGKVWRLGANEATTITFSTDVTVEGQPLAKGTYGLFAIPGADEWQFVFNKVAAQWGAFSYDEAQDALRVTTRAVETPNVEQLRFWFDDVTETSARVQMAWGTTMAGFTVESDTRARIMDAAAASETATDWRVPYRYAAYALTQGLPAEMPLRLAERALTLENSYATVALKARLQAATGDFAGAATTGAAALALGRAMSSPPRDLAELEASVEEWRGKDN